MKALKINVSTIHNIKSLALKLNLIQETRVVGQAITQVNKGGYLSFNVLLCVQFYRPFIFSERSPPKYT